MQFGVVYGCTKRVHCFGSGVNECGVEAVPVVRLGGW
jgi:hypothetical protein